MAIEYVAVAITIAFTVATSVPLGRYMFKVFTGQHSEQAYQRGVRELRAAGRGSGARYFYETTVGAGLPIIQTLRDLVQTGDEVFSVDALG